jgi:hypothetical protein
MVGYLVLKTFMFGTPVYAILALLFWLDPAWKQRPDDWMIPGRNPSRLRRAVFKSLITIWFFSVLTLLGVAVCAFDFLGFLPE